MTDRNSQPIPAGPIDPRRRTVVCKHWLKNLCMKDDKCDYLHQYDLSRMPVCPTWAKGRTCQADDCIFKHADPTEKQSCPRFSLGFCISGSLCKFRHDHSNEIPGYLPDWYFEELIKNFYPTYSARVHLRCDHLFTQTETPPLQGLTRYFIAVFASLDELDKSMMQDILLTSRHSQQVLLEAMRQCENVLLIFSVTDKGFFGFAKVMSSESRPDPIRHHQSQVHFTLKWLKKGRLHFDETNHLRNPYHGSQLLRMAGDCQEVEAGCAVKLCTLINNSESYEPLSGVRRKRERREKRRRRE